MIGKLTGIIDSISEGFLILDVGGVGYLVFASSHTLQQLPEKGGHVSLLIETHVREDHIHLYGFASVEEKTWFGILTTVKGVGTKMALAILSMHPPTALQTAILAQDKAALMQASGVGGKLAERLITELKDKAGSASVAVAGATGAVGIAKNDASGTVEPHAHEEVLQALGQLGYGRSEAYNIVQQVLADDPAMALEVAIRECLKRMVR